MKLAIVSPQHSEYTLQYANAMANRCNVLLIIDGAQLSREYEGRDVPLNPALTIHKANFGSPVDLMRAAVTLVRFRPAVVHFQEAAGVPEEHLQYQSRRHDVVPGQGRPHHPRSVSPPGTRRGRGLAEFLVRQRDAAHRRHRRDARHLLRGPVPGDLAAGPPAHRHQHTRRDPAPLARGGAQRLAVAPAVLRPDGAIQGRRSPPLGHRDPRSPGRQLRAR